jgi:hypothetical protein
MSHCSEGDKRGQRSRLAGEGRDGTNESSLEVVVQRLEVVGAVGSDRYSTGVHADLQEDAGERLSLEGGQWRGGRTVLAPIATAIARASRTRCKNRNGLVWGSGDEETQTYTLVRRSATVDVLV